MNIPNVPIKDLDPQAREKQRKQFQSWKDFLVKQKVIRCITGKENITEVIDRLALEGIYLEGNKAGMAVEFPKSIHHLHDFNNNLATATAYAFFYEEGQTEVIGIGNYDVDFTAAWNLIVAHTTGANHFTSLPTPPDTNIELDTELNKAVESGNKMLENLNKWIDKFNTIPGVKAEVYDGDSPNKLIEVNYQSDNNYLVHPNQENYENVYVNVYIDGTFEFNKIDGEESEVHVKWVKEMKETPDDQGSLQWLYDNLIKLHMQYTKVASELITDSRT